MWYRLTMHLQRRLLIVGLATVAVAIGFVGQAPAANHDLRHRTHNDNGSTPRALEQRWQYRLCDRPRTAEWSAPEQQADPAERDRCQPQ